MALAIRDMVTGNLEEELKLMRNKARSLFARAADITTQVSSEELIPGKKRKREVHNWMEIAQEMKSRIDCIEEEVEQSSSSLFNRARFRDRILKITKEMEDLLGKGGFQNGLTIQDLASSSLPLVTTEMKGQHFEKNMREILCWLSANEVQSIGVYGIGGVGKTTLATHIHDQLLNVLGKTASVCWVTVSRDCTVSMLQEKIAKEVGLVLGDADTMKRPAILSEALKKRSNVVVILDDMWDCFPVEKVGLPIGKNGCKLLLTTRSLEVCRKMGCQKIVRVQILSEKESWSLFMDKWGNCDDLSMEAREVAKLVVKECGGLPLGIIVVAACMRGVSDVYEWNNTLEELRSSTRTHEGMENEVFPSLQLSFNRLRDVKLQDCFLSCALYPEDYKWKRDELVRFWMMEGHLEEFQSRQEQLNRAHTMLNRLTSACLLDATESTESIVSLALHAHWIQSYVKMHDLIRDMAIKISRERHHSMIKAGMQLREVPCLQEWTEEMSKVSLVSNNISEIPSDMSPRCPVLSTLLLNDNNTLTTIPDSFFRFLNGLRFLDLSRTAIERLPDFISHMENLSALNVSSCKKLVYIPSLEKLAKLRHLDMTHCHMINVLPKGMEKLVNLNCLYMNGCYNLCVSFSELTPGLSNIQCLELSHSMMDVQMGDLQRLGCLEKLTGYRILDTTNFNTYVESDQFHQLTSYQLFLGSYYYYGDLYVLPHDRIIIINRWKFECGAEAQPAQLPDNIQKLDVHCCEFHVRSLVEAIPSLNSLTSLTVIIMNQCQGLEFIWSESSCAKPKLESLEKLIISDMYTFRALAKGRLELSSGSLSCLKELIVDLCSKAEKIFTPCLLKGQLRNLEKIDIYGCEVLEEIFAGSDLVGDGDADDESKDEIVELPKLRVLRLNFLPRLVSICKIGLVRCKSIEEIIVFDCPQLKKLPFLLDVQGNGMPLAPPCLKEIFVQRDWWESLLWDNPNV